MEITKSKKSVVQTMSRYEAYKPSGIDWVGEIPMHFRLRRFKNDFGYVKGKNPKETFFLDEANGRDADMPYLSMEYLRNENAEPEFPERDEKLVSVADGESLLLWDGSNAGEFIKSKKGYLSSTMVRIDHSGKILSKYAFYIFQCYERILRDFTNGMGIPHVNGVLLNNTYLPITFDKSEQFSIANYLDDQTQKIDRLIANKKAQAEKLKELRQIEINNAVTKGLNPNAEMKDSGIEWLGKIPKHWEVKRLKNTTFINQSVISEKTPPDYLIKYIDISNVNSMGEFIELQEMEFSEAPSRARRIPKHNSILLSTVRTYLRAIALVQNPDENLIASTGFAVIDANQNLFNAGYLYFQMISHILVERVIANSEGVSYPAISSTKLGDIKIVIPPIKEQTEIANYLQKRTTAIDQLIKNIEAQIEKLQELRKIKIYEAVTGKVRTTDLND